MNVRELIQCLSEFDAETEVVIEYDSHFLTVKAVQPEIVLTQGDSWADYPSAKVLEGNRRFPLGDAEHATNQKSPQHTVVAIWGTTP
ncbi:hypothetical protein DND58_05680 [Pseudomonas syringae pv. pisi]|uniref:hypothetical protein n=1 Tax=Pseudomonas viridiflava TaxID=33069 RepID=UPI000D9FE8A4|nr:hypothetical protein [Pseudomonas viridiflava]PYD32861.1 hypothetical protein DND58_05680 [Pseudomonas syringae pv. pisi]